MIKNNTKRVNKNIYINIFKKKTKFLTFFFSLFVY